MLPRCLHISSSATDPELEGLDLQQYTARGTAQESCQNPGSGTQTLKLSGQCWRVLIGRAVSYTAALVASSIIRISATMDSAMASKVYVEPGRTWASRKAMRGERRREQQFYRFAYPYPRTLHNDTIVLTHS